MVQQTQSQKGMTVKKQAARSGTKATDTEPRGSEERYKMIAEAAYRLAEQRGFQENKAMDDWLQAEAEINAKFEAKH